MIDLKNRLQSNRPKANFTQNIIDEIDELTEDENNIEILPMYKIVSYSINGGGQPFNIDEDEVRVLAESIEEQGQLTPIIVRPTQDNKYQILSGHKRFNALKKLMYKNIKAVVVNADDTAAFDILVQANIQRKETKPSELANMYKTYLTINKDNDKTINDICNMFGVSKKTMYRYANITKLDKRFYSFLDNKIINIKFVEMIIKLTDEQQEGLIDFYNEDKLSSKKLEAVIDYFLVCPDCITVEQALANYVEEKKEKDDIYSTVRRYQKYSLCTDEEINILIKNLLEKENEND